MESKAGKSAIDIDKRRDELLELSSYIQTVDNDVTMILQSLQWDRKHLIEASQMIPCRHDKNHRIPPDKLEDHEKECHLRSLGYSKEELLLPDPLDASTTMMVKLNKNDITNIIDYATKSDPTFKKGSGPGPVEPLSLERLQVAYSADERRAIHDAVVAAAPACHDLGELALLSGDDEAQGTKRKSRADILAELRDMRRRRTKYRGASTAHYSDVLRALIATQMEHYSEVQGGYHVNNSDNRSMRSTTDRSYHDKQGLVHTKKEPFEKNNTYTTERENRRNSSNDYENRYVDKSRDERRHREYSRKETCHRSSRDRSRDKYKEKVYDEYKRDKQTNEKRHRGDRERHSSSFKEGSKDSNDYRSRDGYRGDRRDDRDRLSSSSKERNRDRSRSDYKNSDKYRDDRRPRKDYTSSRSSGPSENA